MRAHPLSMLIVFSVAVGVWPDLAAAQVAGLDLPPVAVTRTDAPLVLSGERFDAIRVDGQLGADEALRLSVDRGTLSLATDEGLVITDGAPFGAASVTFTGAADAVDTALDGLSVMPPPGFAGAVQLTIEVVGPSPIREALTVAVNQRIDAEQARDALLAGVASLHGGNQPGLMTAFGVEAYDIAWFPEGASAGPMVTAAGWGAGAVVAMGDHQSLNMHSFGDPGVGGDSGVFYRNALAWLAGRADRDIAIVTTNANVGGWLVAQGYANTVVTDLNGLAAALPQADVYVPPWLGTRLSAPQMATIADFVRGGGGLLICEYGVGWDWWWGRPKPEAPGNRLLREAGIGFAGGNRWEAATLNIARAAGQVSAETLLAMLADGGGFDEATLARGGTLFSRIYDGLPESDPLVRRLDTAFGDRIEAINPTPQRGVRDAWEQGLLRRETTLLRALAPDEITAHRTADALYGAVPAEAPRVERRVVIDPAVTRWHPVGLYAPPGEVIEVEAPAGAQGRGYVLRLGGHTDDISVRDNWLRPPQVHWSAPIEGALTRQASPFGGTIYIDVGTASRDQAPFEVVVRGGVEQPFFVLGETTDEQWRARVRDLPGPYAELVTPRLAISLPSSMVRALDDPTAVMTIWDDVVAAQDWLGAHAERRYMAERINIDVQVSYGYLHAGYPTQGPLVAGPELVNRAQLARQGSWGWYHELGHEAQRRPDKSWGWDNPYTFDGSVEATVNIYTAYGMFANGMRAAGGWSWTNTRASTMRRAIEGLSGDGATYASLGVGHKLAMFLQLRDGFGWDAFQRIMASYNAPGADLPEDEQQERDQWLVRASQALGVDLTRFTGEVWGLRLSDDAIAQVAPLPDWLPAIGTVEGVRATLAGIPLRLDIEAGLLSHDGVAAVVDLQQPEVGALARGPDGVYTFVAPPGFDGEAQASYGVRSSTGHVATSTLNLQVRPTGAVFERWDGIPGTAVADLRADPRFPDAPDHTELLDGLEIVAAQADNYGARMRAFITPDVDGEYRFWIASDDGGELWLSTDDRPENAALIATVPGWTSAREWDRFAEQRSGLIRLRAGQAYYIEALMKEGGGGDNLAVAWALGEGAPQVIPAESLRAGDPPNQPPVAAPDAASTQVDTPVVIDVLANDSDPDGDPLQVTDAEAADDAVVEVLPDGRVRYTPEAGFVGVARFNYTVEDGRGGVDRAEVTVNVADAPPPPLDVVLVEPAADAWVGACPTFRWQPAAGAQPIGYAIELEQGGQTRVFDAGPETTLTLEGGDCLADGPARWSVIARGPGGAAQPSADRGLQVDGTPPPLAVAIGGHLTGATVPDRAADLGVALVEGQRLRTRARGELCFTRDRACLPRPANTVCSRPSGLDDPPAEPVIAEAPYGALVGLIDNAPPVRLFLGERFDGPAPTDGPLAMAVNRGEASGCRRPGYTLAGLVGEGFGPWFPGRDEVIDHGNPAFEWSAASDAGAGLDRFELLIDGAVVGELPPDARRWAAPDDAPLADGPHTWSIAAIDRVGNRSASAPVAFLVDTTPPGEVVITTPAGGAQVPDLETEVCWQPIDDPSGVEYYRVLVDDDPLARVDADGELCVTVSIAGTPGERCAVVEPYDGTGRTSFNEVCFAYAPAEPAVPIDAPACVGEAEVELRWQPCAAPEVLRTEVLVDGEVAFAADGGLGQARVPFPGEGTFTWAVRCVLSGGVIDSAPEVITIDRTAPVIESLRLLDGPMGVSVDALAVDAGCGPSTIVVTVDEALVVRGDGAVNGPLPALEDGAHTLVVATTDGVGNSATAEFGFVVGQCSALGECVGETCSTPAGPETACDDGDACTGGDACGEGGCSGAELDCDDDDPCTADRCDPDEGCVAEPIPGCCATDLDCAPGSACVEGGCADVRCAECADDAECGADGTCAELPSGAYCVAPCDEDGACESGYTCEDDQCVPATGDCGEVEADAEVEPDMATPDAEVIATPDAGPGLDAAGPIDMSADGGEIGATGGSSGCRVDLSGSTPIAPLLLVLAVVAIRRRQ